MNTRKVLLVISLISLSNTAIADVLSVTVGGGLWNATPDGNFNKVTDPNSVDVKDDLFLDTESQGYAFITIEHFVPIIPNIRVMYTDNSYAGNGASSFTFDGQTFTGNVVSDIKMTNLDLLAYYEVLDNIVSLDIGLNIRQLSIDYTIISTASTTTDSFNETFPMLYALAGVSPWPDFLLSAEMSYVTYSGSTISDLTAKVSYTTNFLLGIEAGYRRQTLKLDNISDTNADVTFDGPFVGAYLKF